MKLRPLVIDESSKAEIQRVRNYARGHRVSLRDFELIRAGARKVVGDEPGHVCVIPRGFRCVFSVEQMPNGDFRRHLSISVIGGGAAPNEYAVGMLMKEFGFQTEFPFKSKPDSALGIGFAIEHIAPGKAAINVVENLITE